MTDKRIRVRVDSGNSKSEIRDLNNEMRGLGRTADSTNKTFTQLSKVASAVASSLAVAQVVSYADAFTRVNNRLSQATSSAREFEAAQRGVFQIAQNAAVSLEGVAGAYSRIAQATSELNLSQEDLLDVTNKLTLALKAGGASAEETSSVMIQLAQGLGSGALQGDELRSILEASIPITKALADEFGVTTGELKTLGAEGQLTADRVISAIQNINQESLTFTKTVSDGFVEVNNALTLYVGELDRATGASEAISSTLSSVAQNIDVIVEALGTLVVLFGARLAGALATSTASALAYVAAASKATVTTNALGQVIARTTVIMRAQAVAARAAGAALAFIGGPVGAAVVAASALAYFITQAETAEERTKRLKQETENLRREYESLSFLQRQRELEQLNATIAETEQAQARVNRQIEQFQNFTDSPIKQSQLRNLNSEAKELDATLAGLILRREELGKVGAREDLDDFFSDPSIFGGGLTPTPSAGGGQPPSTGANQTVDISAQIAREQLATQKLQEEIELRKAFRQGEINQRQLEEEQGLIDVFFQYEQRRLAILENERLTAEQKQELISELNEQEIAAEQLKQEQLTAVTRQGEEDRTEIERLAQNARINNLQSGASSALGLLAAFGDKSFKTQKKFAIAESIVSIVGGVAKALNNPYPANLGFAAQVAAEGAVLISKLKSTNPSSGGSSVAVGGGSAPATPTPVAQESTNNQQRIIDIRGIPEGGSVTLNREELTALLSNDDDVILSVNQGQSNGRRVGLING